MNNYETPYGTVTETPNCIYVTGESWQLYRWAKDTGYVCSELEYAGAVSAGFDNCGLFELTTTSGNDDLPADELSAWTSDVILAADVPTDHPAHYVSCGQFHPELEGDR